MARRSDRPAALALMVLALCACTTTGTGAGRQPTLATEVSPAITPLADDITIARGPVITGPTVVTAPRAGTQSACRLRLAYDARPVGGGRTRLNAGAYAVDYQGAPHGGTDAVLSMMGARHAIPIGGTRALPTAPPPVSSLRDLYAGTGIYGHTLQPAQALDGHVPAPQLLRDLDQVGVDRRVLVMSRRVIGRVARDGHDALVVETTYEEHGIYRLPEDRPGVVRLRVEDVYDVETGIPLERHVHGQLMAGEDAAVLITDTLDAACRITRQAPLKPS